MSEFLIYLQLGFEHIADVNGYDHILFVAALAALSSVQEWRRLLWLITAFTLGHSITLALSTLNIFTLPANLIEFLIPVTIFLTCLANVVQLQRNTNESFEDESSEDGSFAGGAKRSKLVYATAVFFGLIHGLGFSTYLKSLLGRDQNVVLQLLAFNVGLECGQVLIVALVLLLGWLLVRFAGLPRRDWALLVSGAAGGVAVTLMLARAGG